MVPAASPAARPTSRSAFALVSACDEVRTDPSRPSCVQRDRDGGKQEEDPDDVVARFTRLIGEHRQAQRNGPERQRPRRDPVGPADAPASHQAARKPAEVQQRREHIPPERQHPGRVEDFRVRRVEPGQELRRDEVQVPRVAALEEPRREWPVVPGRIEPGHPGRELPLHIQAELDERGGGDDSEPRAPGERVDRRAASRFANPSDGRPSGAKNPARRKDPPTLPLRRTEAPNRQPPQQRCTAAARTGQSCRAARPPRSAGRARPRPSPDMRELPRSRGRAEPAPPTRRARRSRRAGGSRRRPAGSASRSSITCGAGPGASPAPARRCAAAWRRRHRRARRGRAPLPARRSGRAGRGRGLRRAGPRRRS